MTRYRGKEAERRRARRRSAYYAPPNRWKAWAAVRAALKRGDLERSDECSACGDIEETVAHHWSYEPEHWLDVVWMCRPCHQKYTMYPEEV